ncbi:MAG: hydantoinase/oxoprolinase family protein [Candidatus Rokubacteria bacterium]|nr:hydantoinase/oxoprolinase family protein [Candidatus Rokubacteria bacterium]
MGLSRRIGVDVGGTFTDLVVCQEGGSALRSLKVLTTPEAPARGVLEGIRAIGPGADRIAHGTTIVTNAIIEGRGAVTALITTRHFRDVLEIARQNRSDLYRLDLSPKPPPPIPRRFRFEVTERVAADGRVVVPLVKEELPALVGALQALGVEAVAICLLHSYAAPEHEAWLKEALTHTIPYVSASHEINAEFREYERSVTTALNAMVMPLADRYLADLEASLAREGARGSLHLLQSNGGMMSAQAARRRPLAMAVSGPAGGVAASSHLARALGLRHAIAFDMGGTTTDVCLIADGVAQTLPQRRLGGHPIRLPSLAVESIGAGGGSIIWLDSAGALKVGPRSAGARPGPACYGLGGEAATITDAHVVAGTLRPDALLGESIRVERGRAEAALVPLAARVGLPLAEAAAGALEVANAAMLRAIRLISVQRGFDLRDFVLIAYGGAGPLHAGRLARELGMRRVIVPAHAGVFSALGCVVTDLAYDRVQTYRASLGAMTSEDLNRRFLPLDAAVAEPLGAEGYGLDAITLAPSLDLRYLGQNYELEVPWRGDLNVLRRDFEALHTRLYAYATGEAIECVNLRVRALVATGEVRLPEWTGSGTGQPFSEHRAYFPETGVTSLPVYRRDDLALEQPLKGPALVEDPWATTLIYPGQRGQRDRFGNVHIEISP